MIQIIKQLIRFGYNSPKNTNINLKLIRDIEWNAIKEYVPKKSSFLDLGCGTGYLMKKAIEDCECRVVGIDPQPLLAGVRTDITENEKFRIIKGVAENLPFSDEYFDIIHSSHVLEHVQNSLKVFQEIKRVLKVDGIIIIGVPTATSAWINLFTNLLFTSHIRLARYLAGFFIKVRKTKLVHVFIPYSHSNLDQTVISDIRNYKVVKWRALLKTQFHINNEILPALYQFAEFKSPFKIRQNTKYSSSVFFVCTK
jgi:ubiquinone/menaquinone biosynthesis C-methylase UbiE